MIVDPTNVVPAAQTASAVYRPSILLTSAVEITGPTSVPGAAKVHINPSFAPAFFFEICATHEATVAMFPPDATPYVIERVITPAFVSVSPGIGQNRIKDRKEANPKSVRTLNRPYRSARGPEASRPNIEAAFMIATICVAIEGEKLTFLA